MSEAPPSSVWRSQSRIVPQPKALSSRPDLFLVRLLVVLAMALLVIGVLSYLITLAIDGRTAVNPLITTLGAFAHIVVPTTNGDSWGYMITALEFVRDNFSIEAEARGVRAVYDRLWTEGQKPLGLSRKVDRPRLGQNPPSPNQIK